MSRNNNGVDWESISFAAVLIVFLICFTTYAIAKLYA